MLQILDLINYLLIYLYLSLLLDYILMYLYFFAIRLYTNLLIPFFLKCFPTIVQPALRLLIIEIFIVLMHQLFLYIYSR